MSNLYNNSRATRVPTSVSDQKFGSPPADTRDSGKVRMGNGDSRFKAGLGTARKAVATPADMRDSGKVRMGNGDSRFKAQQES